MALHLTQHWDGFAPGLTEITRFDESASFIHVAATKKQRIGV